MTSVYMNSLRVFLFQLSKAGGACFVYFLSFWGDFTCTEIMRLCTSSSTVSISNICLTPCYGLSSYELFQGCK